MEADATGWLPREAVSPALVLEEISMPPSGNVVLGPEKAPPEPRGLYCYVTGCVPLDMT